ncbi:MAG: AmmeMemoRadiSam system protein A [Candidatus Omnitrophota bacterium]|jgi:AmmeMemoRadiSam system protein A
MTELLNEAEAQLLLKMARTSIQAALEGSTLEVDLEIYPEALQIWRAPFVTLYRGATLRGCIGSLEPEGSLLAEVIRLAPAAARDRRFEPVTREELPDIRISLSVLTEPTPLSFTDDADLAAKLRPGIDGLILKADDRRGTLLPVVWETLPDPLTFVRTTKHTAGWQADYASPILKAFVYQAEAWSEDAFL